MPTPYHLSDVWRGFIPCRYPADWMPPRAASDTAWKGWAAGLADKSVPVRYVSMRDHPFCEDEFDALLVDWGAARRVFFLRWHDAAQRGLESLSVPWNVEKAWDRVGAVAKRWEPDEDSPAGAEGWYTVLLAPDFHTVLEHGLLPPQALQEGPLAPVYPVRCQACGAPGLLEEWPGFGWKEHDGWYCSKHYG